MKEAALKVLTGGALIKKRFISLFALVLVGLAGFAWNHLSRKKGYAVSKQLTISAGTPFSFDPIDYDAFTHHFTQRPVLASLVSNYRSGDIIGVLAKGWKVSEDGLEWTFEIRKGMSFSDGQVISPSLIKASLTRTAVVMKQRGSRSGIFEKMVGFGELNGMGSDFLGIAADDSKNTVQLRFVESPSLNGLLDKLSFGLYAVANPKDWDAQTGKWLDPRSVHSSGPYVVESWNDGALALRLRQDFPLAEVYGNERPFDSVTFVVNPAGASPSQGLDPSSALDRKKVDLVSGLKGEQVSPVHEFRGEAQNGILFLRIMGQDNPASPMHAKSAREALRIAFYRVLAAAGIAPTTSFLPLAIAGTSEVTDVLTQAVDANQRNVAAQLESQGQKPILRICDYKAQSGLRKTALDSLVNAAEQMGMTAQVVTVPPPELAKGFDGAAKNVACDAALILTSVLLATPWDDLRFMVHSREGIRLPDPSSRIAAAVDQEKIEPQRFNEAIWDDALVWPILHTTAGLWVNPKRVDTSLLDLIHPPTEVALLRSME
jgi:ABC-type transport system substrate-binding protein